ncbi:MAG: ClbS/DfsB family four-helix bundle protein [Bacilli bacterium]
MGRPKNKNDLILQAQIKFEEITSVLNNSNRDVLVKDFHQGFENNGKEAHWKRDKNIKDLLIHLYEWHELLIKWVNNNISGIKTNFLPAPYNWSNYKELNIEFWEKHKHTSFDESVALFNDGHQRAISLVNEFSQIELFEKSHFDWVGGSSLGQYFISTLSSHYDWALKKIKLHLKNCI